MRKFLFFTLLVSVLIASSCENEVQPEVVGEVQLNFKANYDGALLLMGEEYDYTDDMKIAFTNFNFYVANVSLLEEELSTEETEVIDIDFIDLGFSQSQASAAAAGVTVSAQKVPAGTYRGLKIGFGVPADLNRTTPNDYGSGDALAKNSHYWSAWDSYIFSKIEGIADMDGDGTFETAEGEGLTYHVGTDDTYTERILFPVNPIVIEEGQTLRLDLNIDLKKLFDMPLNEFDENGDNLLDIQTYNGVHTDEDLVIAKQMMNNFSEATELSD